MSNYQINRYDAIPPHIIKALTLCANGSTWADAAAAVGIKAPCLRKWYRDRRAEEFIESLVHENLNVTNNLLTSAAPRLADELIQIALDPSVKAYARTQAISESFKILRKTSWRLSSDGSCKRFGRHCTPRGQQDSHCLRTWFWCRLSDLGALPSASCEGSSQPVRAGHFLTSSPAASPMRTANTHSQLIRLQRKHFLYIEAEDEEAREVG